MSVGPAKRAIYDGEARPLFKEQTVPKKAAGSIAISLGTLEHSGLPRRAQVYRQLRDAILSGRLKAGARLPSTRRLAEDLEIARSTAEEAFEQLTIEGYLVRRVG